MTELVVLSGKGGTGKTSVVASLAVLAGRAVVADCDVDAPDLHLVLAPEVRARHDFVAGFRALVDPDLCNGCGECERACRFDAVVCHEGGPAEFADLACEGCGVCARVCPEQAIRMVERTAGEWMLSKTRCGPMVHARLAVGGSSSGKLVALGQKIRNIRDHGLTEGASTRLLVYAARLIAGGVPPVDACRTAICLPLTDDAGLQETMEDLVRDVF